LAQIILWKMFVRSAPWTFGRHLSPHNDDMVNHGRQEMAVKYSRESHIIQVRIFTVNKIIQCVIWIDHRIFNWYAPYLQREHIWKDSLCNTKNIVLYYQVLHYEEQQTWVFRKRKYIIVLRMNNNTTDED